MFKIRGIRRPGKAPSGTQCKCLKYGMFHIIRDALQHDSVQVVLVVITLITYSRNATPHCRRNWPSYDPAHRSVHRHRGCAMANSQRFTRINTVYDLPNAGTRTRWHGEYVEHNCWILCRRTWYADDDDVTCGHSVVQRGDSGNEVMWYDDFSCANIWRSAKTSDADVNPCATEDGLFNEDIAWTLLADAESCEDGWLWTMWTCGRRIGFIARTTIR